MPTRNLTAEFYRQGATRSSQLCWNAVALAEESSSGTFSGREAACNRRSSSSQKSGVSTVSAAVATLSPKLPPDRRSATKSMAVMPGSNNGTSKIAGLSTSTGACAAVQSLPDSFSGAAERALESAPAGAAASWPAEVAACNRHTT